MKDLIAYHVPGIYYSDHTTAVADKIVGRFPRRACMLPRTTTFLRKKQQGGFLCLFLMVGGIHLSHLPSPYRGSLPCW